MMILLKRVYDRSTRADGKRLLVERLWPRGIKKSALPLDDWVKDIAPSTELRKWFSHDPAKWTEFRRRYQVELATKPEIWKPVLEAARKSTITLVYSSHDAEHNNAVVLKEFLDSRASKTRKAA